MTQDKLSWWQQAHLMDPTLALPPRSATALARKEVNPIPYDRATLFTRMLRGEICLVQDYPVGLRGKPPANLRAYLSEAVAAGFPTTTRARIQAGPARTRTTVSVPELMRRWNTGRARVSTTDLHIRHTRLARQLDIGALSAFNLLCASPRHEFPLEMMTLVVSSVGNLTDSHSDDADGSNHCWLGCKLWLAWERQEGRAAGLEDTTVDAVYTSAAFDLATFLSLRSARWFCVTSGQTLFLPGHLTHKVVTLEDYLGVGSFYVAYPAYFRTLARWLLETTKDVTETMVAEIQAVAEQHALALQQASPARQRQWGWDYLGAAYQHWWQTCGRATRQSMESHPIGAVWAAFPHGPARR